MTRVIVVHLMFLATFLLVFGQVAQANLLSNPSFEIGTTDPNDWISWSPGGTINWQTGGAHTGSKCMDLGDLGGAPYALVYQRVPGAVVGQSYVCKAWAKLNSGAGAAELKLEFHNSSEILIKEHKLNFTATDTWLQYSIDGIAPPNSYYVTATVVGSGGGMVLFDDISLKVSSLTTISSHDPNILYTGRINFDDPNIPVLDWPGTSLIANFEGTSVTAILDDSGDNYFNAIIDDDDANMIVIDCIPDLSYYNIASGLSDTEHKIEINKRTESLQKSVAFNGFKLDESRSLVASPSRPTNKIEYYGDSITVGNAVDDPDVGGIPNKNNYLTYAAVTARNLDAEYHCIAISGISMQQSYVNGTIFDYYDKELGYHSPIKPWDFTKWIPDAVVINLGQNDYTLGSDPNVTDLYVDFMRDIRAEYPDTHIFLVLGDMSAAEPNSPYTGYQQSAVDTMKNTYGDNKVYQLTFDYGGTTHPTKARHAAMADVLTEFILDNVPGLLPPLDGDANGDYDVDYADFALVSKRWEEESCGACGGADLTGDGNVNMEDVKILANNWLDDCR